MYYTEGQEPTTYYQPMTIILEAPTAKSLEPLRRVVADPETTRTHMRKIMAELPRATPSHLQDDGHGLVVGGWFLGGIPGCNERDFAAGSAG